MNNVMNNILIGSVPAIVVLLIEKIWSYYIFKKTKVIEDNKTKISILSKANALAVRLMSEVDIMHHPRFNQLSRESLEKQDERILIVSREKYIEWMTYCIENRVYFENFSKVEEIFGKLLAHFIANEIEMLDINQYSNGSQIFREFCDLVTDQVNRLSQSVY